MPDKRILVLSPWGLGGGYSGPLTLLDRLGAQLAADGYSIDVAYRDRGSEVAPQWTRTTISLGASQRFGRVEQVRWGLAARRLLRSRGREYQAIHLHGFYLANQIAIAGHRGHACVLALPVLDGGDLGSPATLPSRGMKHLALNRAMRSVTSGLALSRGIVEDFRTLGVASDRIALIGNPADPGAFAVGAMRKSRNTIPVVGFVGKIGGYKNPERVIQAIASMRSRGITVRGLFVGPFENDDVRTQLESLIRREQLADLIEFTGFTGNVAAHLAKMDVFVLPSSKEGLPGALTEAMAAALPCVVTDVGSMGAHVREAHGGLVVGSTIDDVTLGIEKALSAEWPTFSRSAHAYATKMFSASSISHAYLRALSSSKGTHVSD